MTEFGTGARPLERAHPLPLWAQLETELRRRLELGHFTDRFPTDRELMEVYLVSRHTARHAVARLGADGIVKRERGIGTSVDRTRLEHSFGSLYSLFQVVEDAGIPQRNEVMHLERTVNARAAEQLGLPADAPLLFLDRLRFAGERPLALDRAWLPFAVAGGLLEAEFTNTSLYDQLEKFAGRRPNAGWECITPVVPDDEERQLLAMPPGEAVFGLNRLGSVNGEPIEWRSTLIRGDRFNFVANWATGQRSELRLQHINSMA